jgi:competence protein ComEC
MTLLYITIAWACGILLCYLMWSQGAVGCQTPAWPFAAASAAALASLVLWRRRAPARLAAAVALFAFLGMWRYDAHPFAACPTPADLDFYTARDAQATEVVMEGVIGAYPDARQDRTDYVLEAETLTIGGQTRPVHGKALIQARRYPAYSYGDRLRVTGRLQEPPVFDDFDYRAYLARQDVRSLVRQAETELIGSGQGSPFWVFVYGLRQRGSALINRVLPEPAAALANGMLLGIEGGIPPDLYDDYRTAGVAHVIVISGSNISLLACVMAFLIARPFGRRRSVPLIIAAVLLYVLVAGAEPPAVRAGIMAGLLLVATALGRQGTAWVSLVTAALIMTILNPLTLWDASFQLSFMATLGLILFTPSMTVALERWLEHHSLGSRSGKVIRATAGLLIATVAAQILVTPLMLYYFGQWSLVSIPANLLVLPAQPPVMAGGMATLAGGLIWEPLGRVLAAIPWLFLTYTNAVVRVAAAIPFASLETGTPSGLLILLFYGVLFGVLAVNRNLSTGAAPAPGRQASAPTGPAVAWAVMVTIPLWLGLSILEGMPDGRLHVSYVPGQQEAVLVVTPGGQHLWIGDWSASAIQTGYNDKRRAPDAIIAVEPAKSATAGIPAVDLAPLAAGAVIMADGGVSLIRLDAGEQWALLLQYAQFRALLPPTLSQESQAMMVAAAPNTLHTTVLKAPGAESRSWPALDFLAAASPQLVLWPEGAAYPPDIEAWLVERGAARYPADALVEVTTDGEQMWLRQYGRVEIR